jgi:hypothetical protein
VVRPRVIPGRSHGGRLISVVVIAGGCSACFGFLGLGFVESGDGGGTGEHAHGQPLVHTPWPSLRFPGPRAPLEEILGGRRAFLHSLRCRLPRSPLQVDASYGARHQRYDALLAPCFFD